MMVTLTLTIEDAKEFADTLDEVLSFATLFESTDPWSDDPEDPRFVPLLDYAHRLDTAITAAR